MTTGNILHRAVHREDHAAASSTSTVVLLLRVFSNDRSRVDGWTLLTTQYCTHFTHHSSIMLRLIANAKHNKYISPHFTDGAAGCAPIHALPSRLPLVRDSRVAFLCGLFIKGVRQEAEKVIQIRTRVAGTRVMV